MEKLSKAAIKREIKANGRVLKRTVDEIVWRIQRYAGNDDATSNVTVVTLLWTLGFELDDARAAADRLCELANR